MPDEKEAAEKLARFDFPTGATAEQIAEALRKARRELMEKNAAAKQQQGDKK